MIKLKPASTNVDQLDQSHLFRSARLILAYADEQGPIPLTPSKAFKRVFVNWAAEAFVWPHWTVEDLYRVNKVLNEYDFGPLQLLHQLLIDLKPKQNESGSTGLSAVLKSVAAGQGRCGFAARSAQLQPLARPQIPLGTEKLAQLEKSVDFGVRRQETWGMSV